jgi:hypothetical protein
VSLYAGHEEVLLLCLQQLYHPEKEQTPRLLTIESNALRNTISTQDNLGYIKFVRVDRALFADILARFAPIYENRLLRQSDSQSAKKPRVAGRALSSKEALFATLRFLAASVSISDLCVSAGVAPATLSRVLHASLLSLLVALRHWMRAAIRPPSNAEAEDLSARVSNRLPYLQNFIGFADGAVPCSVEILTTLQAPLRSLRTRVTMTIRMQHTMAKTESQPQRY